MLDAFVAAGFNFIDTADAYSMWAPGHKGGESEEMIGKWLKARGNRDKVLIATKFAVEIVPGESGLSRAYMRKAVERSLIERAMADARFNKSRAARQLGLTRAQLCAKLKRFGMA